LKTLWSDAGVRKKLEEWSQARHNSQKKWREWLDPKRLRAMTEDELKQQFVAYYESGAELFSFNMIFRDQIIRETDKFRSMLMYLLDESVDVRKRVDAVLDGEFYIRGVGKGLATSFLLDYDPNRYAVWNNRVNAGLQALGRFPIRQRGETWGETYVKILNETERIRQTAPSPYDNYLDVDLLYHIVAADPEGLTALKKADGTFETGEGESRLTAESHLEDLLVENFGSIFPDLSLYQDSDNNGKQYSTDIGDIDLLATDKKGDFVVMELKLDKPSDSVVGQLQRYMGWVKQHLANKGENVRGVIIAKDLDKKLKYALSVTKDIEFCRYRIRIEVESARPMDYSVI
jgi:hypothetical protein